MAAKLPVVPNTLLQVLIDFVASTRKLLMVEDGDLVLRGVEVGLAIEP